MRATRGSFLAIFGLVAVLSLSDVASAHTVSFSTSLSISRSPSGTVAPGTKVTFSGRLSSEKKACKNGSKIQLIRVGEGVVATRRTDDRGNYSFRVTVNQTARWKTRYRGEVLNATHPHNHTCKASASNRIRVPVE